MEESIRDAFALKQPDPRGLPVLSLAYLGDAVYELVLRTLFTEREGGKNGALHEQTRPYVSAVGQARIAQGLLPELSEAEAAVYRRGLNAKPGHSAKNADSQEYRRATGLEALIGTLYLEGKTDRILELIRKGMPYAVRKD